MFNSLFQGCVSIRNNYNKIIIMHRWWKSSTSMWPNNKSDERLNMHARVREHILSLYTTCYLFNPYLFLHYHPHPRTRTRTPLRSQPSFKLFPKYIFRISISDSISRPLPAALLCKSTLDSMGGSGVLCLQDCQERLAETA